jgi:small subunit ribosomal protein S16
MVRIRLRRVGSKNQPSFRIVAADKESPRDGRFLENLGMYNPRTEPATIRVKEARLFEWLSNGAQPSDSVVRVLKSHGAWDRWERFKAGEDIEKLLAEAESSLTEVDPRTRRDDLAESRKGKKKSKKP